MAKYTLERWLLGSTLFLAGLIIMPGYAHAFDFSSGLAVISHPRLMALALLICYVTIKLLPSNRQHF